MLSLKGKLVNSSDTVSRGMAANPARLYKPAWKVLFVLEPGRQAAKIHLAPE